MAWSGSSPPFLQSVSKERNNSIITSYHTCLPHTEFTRQVVEPLLRLRLRSVERVGFQNFFLSQQEKSQMTERRQVTGSGVTRSLETFRIKLVGAFTWLLYNLVT